MLRRERVRGVSLELTCSVTGASLRGNGFVQLSRFLFRLALALAILCADTDAGYKRALHTMAAPSHSQTVHPDMLGVGPIEWDSVRPPISLSPHPSLSSRPPLNRSHILGSHTGHGEGLPPLPPQGLDHPRLARQDAWHPLRQRDHSPRRHPRDAPGRRHSHLQEGASRSLPRPPQGQRLLDLPQTQHPCPCPSHFPLPLPPRRPPR